MTTPSKIFVEVSVTNNEFIKVLTQLGYRSELTEERYCFVNDKYDSIVVVPAHPLDEPVQRIYVANYSYQLYMQGVIKDEESLVKMVQKNRAKTSRMASN
jgi:predicted RNA binding protein YcfA (HicA-like mRNA interferase family)